MREAPLTDRQRIVKGFVVGTLGLAVLFGSRAVDRSPGRLCHRQLPTEYAFNDGNSLLLSHRQGYGVHTLT